jgi:hypothetical protein
VSLIPRLQRENTFQPWLPSGMLPSCSCWAWPAWPSPHLSSIAVCKCSSFRTFPSVWRTMLVKSTFLAWQSPSVSRAPRHGCPLNSHFLMYCADEGSNLPSRQLLNFNTCPQGLPVFWNGWCFPSQFHANRAAAAAGEGLPSHSVGCKSSKLI